MPVEQIPPNDWARLILELIARPGWNRTRLAHAVGVNRNTIRRWADGETTNIEGASMRLVADAMDIDYEVVARAALNAQQRQIDHDDTAMKEIMESDLPQEIKDELIEYVHQHRVEAEEQLRRHVGMVLRARQAS